MKQRRRPKLEPDWQPEGEPQGPALDQVQIIGGNAQMQFYLGITPRAAPKGITCGASLELRQPFSSAANTAISLANSSSHAAAPSNACRTVHRGSGGRGLFSLGAYAGITNYQPARTPPKVPRTLADPVLLPVSGRAG
jgi:hypothetical protein